MNLALPDKYIRKALYDLLNNMVVNTNTIKIYDSYVPLTSPSYYILMTTQTNNVNESVKCGDRWESSILLDIVTRYQKTGNPGSRLLADDIADAVRNLLTSNLTLGGGLNVIDQKLSFPNDLTASTENENIFRKLIRIEFTIN